MDRSPKNEKGPHAGAEPLPPENVIFGCTQAMDLVRRRAVRAASANVPLLIQGEAGTGKEVLARWVHQRSAVSRGSFVKVNCAAIPAALLESEMFGYEKGAFTGAYTSKPGRVELADNGTLFLDEISDLHLGLQSKLLHFLQDGQFCRIGDTAERRVNTRVICASRSDLAEEVGAGRFRADLFYRINVVQLSLPPLRERKEDIPNLAEHFRRQHMAQFEARCDALRSEVLLLMQGMNWPGNMRELSNGIARYVLIGQEGLVGPNPLKNRVRAAATATIEAGTIPLKRIAKEAIRKMERRVIVEALTANHWNRRKTAEALRISYRALIYKIRDAGLSDRNRDPGLDA